MYGKYAYSVSMRKLFLIVLVIISAAILNASEAGDNFKESLAIAGYTSEKVHEEERGITTSIGASIGYRDTCGLESHSSKVLPKEGRQCSASALMALHIHMALGKTIPDMI